MHKINVSKNDLLDAKISEDQLREFYTKNGIPIPKKLLPREVVLFSILDEENQILSQANESLVDEYLRVSNQPNHDTQVNDQPDRGEGWMRRKNTTTCIIIVLSVSIISAFVQFSLDSDRKSMMNELKRLDQSSLNADNKVLQQQNRELNEQLKNTQKKSCFLF